MQSTFLLLQAGIWKPIFELDVYILYRWSDFILVFVKNIVGEDPKTTLSHVNNLTAFQKNAFYLEAPVHNT